MEIKETLVLKTDAAKQVDFQDRRLAKRLRRQDSLMLRKEGGPLSLSSSLYSKTLLERSCTYSARNLGSCLILAYYHKKLNTKAEDKP